MTETNRNPRTHFTDDLYGIRVSNKLGRVLLKLHYLDETGSVKSVSPTWSFSSELIKNTAMKLAKEERKKLLSQPQFQAYLNLKYADATGNKSLHVKPYKTATNATIPVLNGVYVDLKTSKARSDGRPMHYLNITAHGPMPNGKTKYRSWSVRKHGVHGALIEAVKWRTGYVGGTMPPMIYITNAEKLIIRNYKEYFSANSTSDFVKPKHDSNSPDL